MISAAPTADMIIMTVVAISADKIEGLADAYKTSTW